MWPPSHRPWSGPLVWASIEPAPDNAKLCTDILTHPLPNAPLLVRLDNCGRVQTFRKFGDFRVVLGSPTASRRSSLRQNSLQQIRSIFVSSRDVEHALTNLRVLDFIRLSPKLLSAIADILDSGFSISETRSHEGGNRQQSRLVPPQIVRCDKSHNSKS